MFAQSSSCASVCGEILKLCEFTQRILVASEFKHGSNAELFVGMRQRKYVPRCNS